MATFPDLSEYTYFAWGTQADPDAQEQRMLNVGWLGRDLPFERGAPQSAVVEALIVLADAPRNLMRGYHYCEFCDAESPIRVAAPVPRGYVNLGNGEIHVQGGDGLFYAAPTLIVHYIVEHEYRPPEEFQAAAIEAAKSLPLEDQCD